MKILVGSSAAKISTTGFKSRNFDVDIWTDVPTSKEKNLDIGIFPTDILESFEEKSKQTEVATVNDLTTIKLSHLPYDVLWKKHSRDYLVLKMNYGGKINQKLYDKLRVHWCNHYGNKPYLSLYKTKDSFFDDFVSKQFDHDYLHELVSYPNKPIYTECLKDGEQVAIDKEKFNVMLHNKKIQMFREEMCVIALERWVIPSKHEISFLDAWSRSVHKTVTRLTKGWASEFICENLESFIKPDKLEIEHAMKELKL